MTSHGRVQILSSGSPVPTSAAVLPSSQVPKPAHLAQLESVFHRWLYIEDPLYIENLGAVRLAMEYPGDPYWEMVIGPPGVGKTEAMRALTHDPKVYTISKFTPQTLISGFSARSAHGKPQDFDLYPELVGKLVIVKDAGSLLSMRWEHKAQIFADLREAYDGELAKAWGSRRGKKSYTGTFGLLIGATPAGLDSARSFHAALGERFVHFRLQCNDTEKAVAKARECRGREDEMRRTLKAAVKKCLSKVIGPGNPPYADISPEAADRIDALAVACATLRTPVTRDRQGNPTMKPEPEVATRLVKQFWKLGHSIAWLYGHSQFGERELAHIERVAVDSMVPLRLEVLRVLQDGQEHYSKDVGLAIRMPAGSATKVLDDLFMLSLVHKDDRPFSGYVYGWTTRAETVEMLSKAKLL